MYTRFVRYSNLFIAIIFSSFVLLLFWIIYVIGIVGIIRTICGCALTCYFVFKPFSVLGDINIKQNRAINTQIPIMLSRVDINLEVVKTIVLVLYAVLVYITVFAFIVMVTFCCYT